MYKKVFYLLKCMIFEKIYLFYSRDCKIKEKKRADFQNNLLKVNKLYTIFTYMG